MCEVKGLNPVAATNVIEANPRLARGVNLARHRGHCPKKPRCSTCAATRKLVSYACVG